MPVFNGEKFVSEAIDSLLAQTEARFELIISDNCSTDNTYEICKNYAAIDNRIKLLRHNENRGALENFTTVLQNADCDYFLWAACDDIWSRDWLAKLLALHREETSIAFGSVVNIYENGTAFKTYESKNLYKRRLLSKFRFFLEEDTLGKANIIYGMYPTKLIRKVGLETLGSVKYGDDMLFVFQFLRYGNIVFDPTAKLYKRVPEYPTPRISFKKVLRRSLIIERLPTFISYGYLANKYAEKVLIYSLIPLKYALSFNSNFLILVKKYLKK